MKLVCVKIQSIHFNCFNMRTRPASSPTTVQYILHHILPWVARIFRTYWFSGAIGVIVLLAIAGNNLRVHIGREQAPVSPAAHPVAEATVPAATKKTVTRPAMNVSMIPKKPVAAPVATISDLEPMAASPSGLATDAEKTAYIQRFAPLAKEERNRYGIPASITLAQGLLESNAGKSPLAASANNHFGIKCFSQRCYKGHCKNYSDDSHKDFFRVYPNAWESFRAHSLFLKRDRYVHLFKLGKKDYRAWARGLSKAGYATDPSYADKLIGIIEKFNLNQYD